MSKTYDRLANLLAMLPVLLLTVFVNVFIAASTAGVVFLQLIDSGWSKNLSCGVAVLVAIAVLIYIWLQPKIRNYIKVRSMNE